MKTKLIYTLIAVVTFGSFCTAQDIQKKAPLLSLESIPAYFPLKKKDFIGVSSMFGLRKHPILHKTKMHSGIDLAAPKGTAVIATAAGVVETSNFKVGYGNYITIHHLPNVKTVYAHLWINLTKKGDVVSQGQIIGIVGDTGLATGPHLHYEIHVNNKKIDPLSIWKNVIKNHFKQKA
ncbi:M23 family metallopeptidase [Aquimarina sp. LLG6339-5]|uniref:M23 family metallopeptidase n=1 Tax=Aquimarina sp. LLG6339-5 TaxID=3160830 RepID=UPI0038697DD4